MDSRMCGLGGDVKFNLGCVDPEACRPGDVWTQGPVGLGDVSCPHIPESHSLKSHYHESHIHMSPVHTSSSLQITESHIPSPHVPDSCIPRHSLHPTVSHSPSYVH